MVKANFSKLLVHNAKPPRHGKNDPAQELPRSVSNCEQKCGSEDVTVLRTPLSKPCDIEVVDYGEIRVDHAYPSVHERS